MNAATEIARRAAPVPAPPLLLAFTTEMGLAAAYQSLGENPVECLREPSFDLFHLENTAAAISTWQ
jgi:hypothetical protein